MLRDLDDIKRKVSAVKASGYSDYEQFYIFNKDLRTVTLTLNAENYLRHEKDLVYEKMMEEYYGLL